MRILLTALLIAFPFAANAVTLSVVSSDSTSLVLNQGGNLREIRLDQLRPGSDALRVADMETKIRDFAQVRQLLSGIPLDDPDRAQNPGSPNVLDPVGRGERQFWCEADGTPLAFGALPSLDTYLCGQSSIISDIFIDATGAFVLTIRTARDCSLQPAFPACGP